MKIDNNLIKTLGIALIAIVLGSGIVAAAHVGSHGAAYITPDGLAELKSGDLTGDYTCWNDHDTKHHKTCIVTVDGVDFEITYKVAGKSGAKIVGVEKLVPETPVVENETEPVTPVQNETEPVVPVVENETEPVVPQNETEPVVPVTPVVPVVENETTTVENNTEHASGDDVTVAPATNNTDVNNTVENATETGLGSIVMENAGNPYILLVIAIFLLIGAVAYNKRD